MVIITWNAHFGLHALFNDMSWEVAEPEINAFLTHLAVKEKVSASTQNQALSALLFLYRHVIGREVGDLGEVIRTIQELPWHKDVGTTMIYTHVLNRGGHEVRGTQPDGWAIVRFIQTV